MAVLTSFMSNLPQARVIWIKEPLIEKILP